MRHPNGRALRTVWILGAGFSKSLGGPLLPELFRAREWEDLLGLFPPQQYPGSLAGNLYRATNLYQQGKSERQWDDPEQFLDSLEAIVRTESSGHAQQINGLLKRRTGNQAVQPTKELLIAAKQCLGADCTMFLRTADPAAERWSPYRAWIDWMHRMVTEAPACSDRHIVVTFNYDRVLELIDPDCQRIKIPLPGDPLSGERVNVLKVHGSVDWKCTRANADDTDRVHFRTGGDITFQRARPEEALLCEGSEIAMATPGPGKREAGTEPLWRLAEDALRFAEVVVFMGYRFPPGDADARRRVLNALLQNKQPHVQVLSVLGPNVASEESVRLRHLLTETARKNRVSGWWGQEQTSATFHVSQVPLYAEDYLALFGELNLFQFGEHSPANGG